MPVVSKYNNETIENLTNKLQNTLIEEQANVELSLMVIGNLLSHLINTNVESKQKQQLVENFCTILKQSTKN